MSDLDTVQEQARACGWLLANLADTAPDLVLIAPTGTTVRARFARDGSLTWARRTDATRVPAQAFAGRADPLGDVTDWLAGATPAEVQS